MSTLVPRVLAVGILAMMTLTMGCRQFSAVNDEGAVNADKRGSSDKFGPMAVIDNDGATAAMASGGRGIVTVGTRCIYLQLPNRKLQLIWNSGTAKWDADDNAVLFSSDQGAEKIKDGDSISVGGAELVNSNTVKWLKPPDASCEGDRWRVDTLQRLDRN